MPKYKEVSEGEFNHVITQLQSAKIKMIITVRYHESIYTDKDNNILLRQYRHKKSKQYLVSVTLDAQIKAAKKAMLTFNGKEIEG
jgi:hypothetical protein